MVDMITIHAEGSECVPETDKQKLMGYDSLTVESVYTREFGLCSRSVILMNKSPHNAEIEVSECLQQQR